MAEDLGKEEEKFDFTPEGESLGYISLEQARLLAMQTARDVPGDYGRRFRRVPMAFEVVQANDGEDYYEVTLSIRPQGDFSGRTGQEQFFIEKEGTVAHRQVMSLPRLTEGRLFPILPIAIGVVIVGVIIAVGAVFMLGGTGDDRPLVAVAAPTETPLATEAPTPAIAPTTDTIILTPTPTRLIRPALTPRPTLTPTPTRRPTPRPNATSYFNKGKDYYEDGKYQLAIDEFATAIRLNADYTNAYNRRGIAYASLGQYKLAIEDYDKAIQLDPGFALAYNNRGIAYANLGQYKRAIEDYDKAIQLDPGFARPYHNRGAAYASLGQYKRAIEDYDKAIQLDPGFALAYNNRGIAYRELGHTSFASYDEATACSLDSKYC